jgi:hypothetical protein
MTFLLPTRLWIAGFVSLTIHSLALVPIPNGSLALPSVKPMLVRLAVPAVSTRSEAVRQIHLSGSAGSENGIVTEDQTRHDIALWSALGLPTAVMLGTRDDRIFPPDQVDVRPQINMLEFPEFPATVAISEKLFRIRIFIGADGNPELLESLEPNALPPELMTLAQHAVDAGEFSPAYVANSPVRSWVSLELQLSSEQREGMPSQDRSFGNGNDTPS